MTYRPISPWWAVFAGLVGSAVGAGTIMVYAYGILSVGMGAEFGWDRTMLASNMSAFLLGSGFGTVALGWLISRFGIRGPSAIMAALFGASFTAVAILPAEPLLFNALFFLGGVGGAACTPMPYAVSISGYFDARRGLALGIVVAGAGIGATVWPQAARLLAGSVPWREGFVVTGLVAGLVPVLGLLLLVRTPHGVVATAAAGSASEVPRSFKSLFIRNREFWMIAIPILAVSVATFGGMASLVSLFGDRHFDPLTIASILSFAGLVSWAGRLIVGYLLDELFASYVCAVVFGLAASGFLILVGTDGVLPAYLGAALVALAMGAESDFVTFLVSRYFRLVDFSRVVGVLWVVWAWGGGLGTVIASQLYQTTGSYHPSYVLFATMLVIGGVIICFVGPYRNPVRHEGGADDREIAPDKAVLRSV